VEGRILATLLLRRSPGFAGDLTGGAGLGVIGAHGGLQVLDGGRGPGVGVLPLFAQRARQRRLREPDAARESPRLGVFLRLCEGLRGVGGGIRKNDWVIVNSSPARRASSEARSAISLASCR